MLNNKDYKYNKILLEWKKLFEKYWYKPVTIDKITDKCWIAKWTFYLYFDSKGHLYKVVVSNIIDLWVNYVKDLSSLIECTKTKLFYKMVSTLIFIDSNSITRNMFLWNTNYLSNSVWKDYLKKKNLQIMSFFTSDDRLNNVYDWNLEFIWKIVWFYPVILFYKTKFENEVEYYKFAVEYAKILVNWLFDNIWSKNDLKINITKLKKIISAWEPIWFYFDNLNNDN